MFPQPKPHFQPSSKREPTSTTSSVAPESGDQPMSYADFIVQSKKNPSAPNSSKPARIVDAVISQEHNRSSSVSAETGRLETAEKCARGVEGESKVVQNSEPQPDVRTDPNEGSCQKSDSVISLGPRPVGSGSSIIVSPRQVPSGVLLYPDHFSAKIITF